VPSEGELDWARRAASAYEAGEREGLGAVGLDGAMIDRPVYLRARALIDRAGAAAARSTAGPSAST
jgi:citrate lyase subunit beta / citryl-CoA lyase